MYKVSLTRKPLEYIDTVDTEESTKDNKSTDKSTDRSADRSTDKSADRSADKSADRSSDKSTDRSADKSADRSSDKSTDRSADRSADKSEETNVSRTSNKSMNKTKKIKTPMMPEEKARHEEKRNLQFADMEEYKKKLGLIGVTMIEYGPAHMRLLGHLINKRKSGEDGSFDKTRKSENVFAEKNLKNQSNKKQRKDTYNLFSLIKRLKITENCPEGRELVADLQENENKPSRYIFLFLKTIKAKQYVVGFVSASKNKQDEGTAVVDYICPKLEPPPEDGTKWKTTESLDNFAAYAILKFLWFNDNNQKKYKYSAVVYKNSRYDSYEKVFKNLVTIEIDDFASNILNFKRRSEEKPSVLPVEGS